MENRCMVNILLIEDNVELCELIEGELEQNGYKVFTSFDGESGIETFCNERIDLVITDIMMPKCDGFSVITYIRQINENVPILIITAKISQEDKYKGFKAGTDDYMTKPIDIDELVLRVGALLKRAKINTDKKLEIGNAVLNYEDYSVTIDGETMNLPQKEFQILFKLLSYPDKIFTRYQLMSEIWGINSDSDEITVYTHVHRLRNKFKDCKYFEIVTMRNLGYKAVIK